MAAVARLPKALGAHLDVYGDGPFRGGVEAAIAEHGAAARVTLHGRLPLDDLPAVLAETDIGLVPTRPEPYMDYSLSTKLLEYVAMGVPVIAFGPPYLALALRRRRHDLRPGRRPRRAGSGHHGPRRRPARAQAQADAATRQAEPYGWSIQVATYLAVVEGLLARGRLAASGGV